VKATTVLRRIAAVVTSAALAGGMAGCAGSAEATTTIDGLAIVVGGRSNMPPPRLLGAAGDMAEAAVTSEATLSVVVADGNPYASVVARPLAVNHANDVVEKRDHDNNLRYVANAVSGSTAKTAETDLLTALDLAARGLPVGSGDRALVVLDSGLSTVGPLDFRKPGLLDSDPLELATSLKAGDELPDLTGVDVVFQGLGDTASPQDKPRIPQRKSLIAIWTAIAVAAGAESVVVEESPLSGEPAPELPPVTPVAFVDGFSCEANTVSLTGGDVAFQPDSADFKDRSAASAVVGPIAQQMLRDQISATLTGTTANVGNGTGQAQLSELRAKAVVDLLVELGVPAERMTAKGLGSDFPGFVEDHDAAGNLVPEKAALNRKVDIELAGEAGAVACN
jgi:outer membrane protein OmpA-like peptidoglycan-associated protein